MPFATLPLVALLLPGAPATRKTCAEPLRVIDLVVFDPVPDDQLTVDELGAEGVDCLAARFLATPEVGVRDAFRSQMTQPTRDAVTARLKRAAPSARLEQILSVELPKQDWQVRGELSLEGQQHRTDTGLAQRVRVEDQHAGTAARVEATRRSRAGGLDLRTMLRGAGRSQRARQTIREGGKERRRDVEPARLEGSLALRASAPDETLQLWFDGRQLAVWDAVLNAVARPLELGGGARLAAGPTRNAVSAAWTDTGRTPPAVDGPLRQQEQRLDIQAESAVLSAGWASGAVVRAVHGDRDTTGNFFWEREQRSEATGFVHWNFADGGYLRVGAGGGRWSTRLRRVDDAVLVETSGTATQLAAESRWGPWSLFELSTTALLRGQRSEGTFEGWHPAWELKAECTLKPQALGFRVDVSGAWLGHEVDLNESQARSDVSLGSKLHYQPADGLSLELAGAATRGRLTGYGAAESDSADGSFTVRVELAKRPTWLISTGIYTYRGRWAGETNALDWAGYGGSLQTSVAL
jgi:hypothetical protein